VSYDVRLRPAAERDLSALPKTAQDRALRQLAALADDPPPPGAGPLPGELRGLWRVRVGDYRVSYVIDDETQTVRVGRIGHLSTFYKRVRGK
jgi:mRNA interferase RelE/StbE